MYTKLKCTELLYEEHILPVVQDKLEYFIFE